MAAVFSGAANAEGASSKERQSDISSPLSSILGREIVTRDGDQGRAIDVLADPAGQSKAIVVEVGGFLGIGTRKIAVEWQALRVGSTDPTKPMLLDISGDRLRSAPEYRPDGPPIVVTAN